MQILMDIIHGDSDGWTFCADLGDWSDSMWVKDDTTKARGFWLSSPSAEYDIIHYMKDSGEFGDWGITRDSIGFRPLVAIPKSSLK